jgi:hypothetical protein
MSERCAAATTNLAMWADSPPTLGCTLPHGHDGEHDWSGNPQRIWCMREERARSEARDEALVARGIREERARVVAYLRRVAAERFVGDFVRCDTTFDLANEIEGEEHTR